VFTRSVLTGLSISLVACTAPRQIELHAFVPTSESEARTDPTACTPIGAVAGEARSSGNDRARRLAVRSLDRAQDEAIARLTDTAARMGANFALLQQATWSDGHVFVHGTAYRCHTEPLPSMACVSDGPGLLTCARH